MLDLAPIAKDYSNPFYSMGRMHAVLLLMHV